MELELLRIEKTLSNDSNIIMRTISSKLSIEEAKLVSTIEKWKKI